MARYSVFWDEKKASLHIRDATDRKSKSREHVGEIFLPVAGEIPDAAPHPEPGEHLKNLARQQGYDDYRLVSVVNDTDNPGADRFAKEADEQYVEAYEKREAAKVQQNGPFATAPADQDPGGIPEEKRGTGNIPQDTKEGIKEGPTPN